jgi:ABC-type transport system substrate-binding protein
MHPPSASAPPETTCRSPGPAGDGLPDDRGLADVRDRPARDRCAPSSLEPGKGFVGSGGYVLTTSDETATTLAANDHYWAGRPAIGTVQLVHDIGGRGAVTAFEDGDVDSPTCPRSTRHGWPYDASLGPQLRRSDGLSLRYYGFDTSRAPFDDVRVPPGVQPGPSTGAA